VIPSSWQGFKATRVFRNVQYYIRVERKGAGKAVQLLVDGQPIQGSIIPLPPEGVEQVNVQVLLG
jgi:cellobiose phosphorylase